MSFSALLWLDHYYVMRMRRIVCHSNGHVTIINWRNFSLWQHEYNGILYSLSNTNILSRSKIFFWSFLIVLWTIYLHLREYSLHIFCMCCIESNTKRNCDEYLSFLQTMFVCPAIKKIEPNRYECKAVVYGNNWSSGTMTVISAMLRHFLYINRERHLEGW